eukprot:7897830-Pyramimonas_sp.AAC.1
MAHNGARIAPMAPDWHSAVRSGAQRRQNWCRMALSGTRIALRGSAAPGQHTAVQRSAEKQHNGAQRHQSCARDA